MNAPISADDYRARLLADIAPVSRAPTPLTDALGLVLATDLLAREQIPPFTNSAMDGYAVIAADVADATPDRPLVLPVADDIPAGRTDRLTLSPGTVMRIMTGAPLPDGADAIVPVEATDGGTSSVAIRRPAATGAHVRRAGDDLTVGDLVLRAGTRLTARHLGAAAAAGHGILDLHARPRVAVISTGSELVEPGRPLAFGQIPESNSHVLAASVAEAGCLPVRVAAVPDEEDALRETLASLSPQVDAIILSGGVSVGAYDVVKAVLAPLPTMWFGPVAMQPGKPQGSGRLEDGTLVITLPGNPVSVYVSFEVFVRSALRRLAGELAVEPRFLPARAAVDWTSPAGREQYMPVTISHEGITPLVHPASRRGSGSHLVGGLAGADGLARVPAAVTEVRAGDEIHVLEGAR
ncbi:molybdopterin molybdotransferase MoeA [Pseudactinotalea suaedae]|uniref:molybdopterin molybdotransferase MoeA n=1 Tax=Pseudactinotalea suaedae TaxID=1524924 RepID=UPI0012E1D328|nr:gephyrin-like molybdotransferase Glp [Pseudactinotalea suaedae]